MRNYGCPLSVRRMSAGATLVPAGVAAASPLFVTAWGARDLLRFAPKAPCPLYSGGTSSLSLAPCQTGRCVGDATQGARALRPLHPGPRIRSVRSPLHGGKRSIPVGHTAFVRSSGEYDRSLCWCVGLSARFIPPFFMDEKNNTIGLTELLNEIGNDLDEYRKKHEKDYQVKPSRCGGNWNGKGSRCVMYLAWQ